MKGLDLRVAVTLGSSAGASWRGCYATQRGGKLQPGFFVCILGGQGAPYSCGVKQLDKVSQEQERSSQNPQINFLAIWEIRELHQPNVCAAKSQSKHPVRLWESGFPSKPEQSEAFNFITDSLRGAQLCKSFKVIGEGVNIHTSERPWIHYEQEDASFKLVYGSWIIFQLCGCDNEFNVLF